MACQGERSKLLVFGLAFELQGGQLDGLAFALFSGLTGEV